MGLGVLIPPELMGYRDVRSPTPVYRCLGRGWGPLQLCPLEAAPVWTDSSYLLDAGGGFHPPQARDPVRLPPSHAAVSPSVHQGGWDSVSRTPVDSLVATNRAEGCTHRSRAGGTESCPCCRGELGAGDTGRVS